MANVHVLDRQGQNFRLAYHVAIPAANNGAGVSYRTAVVNSGLGGTTVLPDGDGTAGTISAAEKAQLTAGEIVERVVLLDVMRGGNPNGAAIASLIQEHYNAVSAELLAGLQAALAQFGRSL